MKKRFGIKAGLVGLVIAATGAVTTAPAMMPQIVMAAEADYQITRNIKIYIVQADGSKKLQGTVPQTMEVPGTISKDYSFTFPEVKVSDLLGKGFEVYTPDKTTVPAVKGSYNKPPADAEVVLNIDPSKGLTGDKNIVRTIEYYTKGEDGKEVFSGKETYTLTFPRGAALTDAATFPDKTVPSKTGYTSDRTVVKGKTVKASDSSFTEKVVYTKNANVTTETKTVWRKINFIDKDTGKQIKGSRSKGVTFSREVYKDANGNTVVVRDWQASGTIPEYTVPEIDGYTHSLKTVPAKKVTVNTKDYEVDVYYTSTRFTVNYHLDDSSAASSKKTVVDYGTWTKTLTISELKFSKTNCTFIGWRAYREIDDSWYAKDVDGIKKWVKLTNGQLPSGYEFVIYRNGQQVKALAKRGDTHFYGQWQENRFIVNYHLDNNSKASEKTTSVTYGTWTSTLKTTELGFNKTGKKFAGWRAYREIDDSWYLKDTNGNKKWMKLSNGKLPSGYDYVLYSNGQKVMALAKSGNAHFYGQWK